MAYCFVSAPGQLQGDVHPLALVGLAAVCLQGDARGGCITDHCHQLVAVLELVLLVDVHLHSASASVTAFQCLSFSATLTVHAGQCNTVCI